MRRVRNHGARAVAGLALASALSLAPLAPARAEVLASSDAGFVVRTTVEVKASPAEAWSAIVRPADWWLGQHTFSGDAANLTLDPAPGGCFCERLPAPRDAAKGQGVGGVQHMRVVYSEPGKALRLTGALGPLQSEAVLGTLTMTIKPVEGGTRILWEYVVGGYMRYKMADIAPAVDRVLVAQISSLAKRLGPVIPEALPAPAPTAAMGPVDDTVTAPQAPAETAPPSPAAPALSPSGKTWSLPPAPGTAPVKPVAPRPIPPKPAAPKPAAAKPATAPTPAAKPDAAKAGTAKPAAAKPSLQPAAKPAPKPAAKASESAADKDRRDGIDAFDQALGVPHP